MLQSLIGMMPMINMWHIDSNASINQIFTVMGTYRKGFPNGFICHALLITWHKGPAHPAQPSH